jgi:hypothetical protein
MTADSDPAAVSMAAPPGYRYAGRWIRFAALIIDEWLLVAAVAGLVFGLRAVILDSAGLNWHLNDWVGFCVTTGVFLGWFAGWQAAAGATPAMLLLGLRVRGPSGEGKPSLIAAVIRNSLQVIVPILAAAVEKLAPGSVVAMIANLAVLVIFATIGVSIANSPTCQGIHDRLAGGTFVLRRAREPASTL